LALIIIRSGSLVQLSGAYERLSTKLQKGDRDFESAEKAP
jgi:hypothetical protein